MTRKSKAKKEKNKGTEEKDAYIHENEEKESTKDESIKASSKKELEELEKFRKDQLETANKYTDEVLKLYKKFVKAIVLFGSFTRGDFHKKSDIDMLIIIDDTIARFTPEMKWQFDEEIRILAEKISKDIIVQPAWSLTEFWDMARIGHPLLYTIVRDGWALYDTGFFIPIRKLLQAGKIPTTLEAVEKFMEGAPKKIQRVETAKLYMIAEDLYYAMLNSSQAVLMYLGENPPAPKETPNYVREFLIKPSILEEEYLKLLEEVIGFRKGVEHKEINDVKGERLDELIDKTKKYVDRMEQLLTQLEKKKKERMIVKNYEVMIKAAVTALKQINELPPDPKDLPKAIKDILIGKKEIHPMYEDVFKRVITMRKMLDDKKIAEIPEKDIQLAREYVRRFVRDLEPLMITRKKEEEQAKKKK